MKNKYLRFQKGDFWVIGLVLSLAAVIFLLFLPLGKQSAAYAEIYLDGELVQRVSLAEDRELTVTGAYTNTIAVWDGKIAVTDSDCPGRDCVGCGWVDSTGRSIVCLPNCLEIRIVGTSGDVDFVVG